MRLHLQGKQLDKPGAAGSFTALQLRGLTDVHEHVIHVADGER